MDGALGPIIESCIAADEEERLASLGTYIPHPPAGLLSLSPTVHSGGRVDGWRRGSGPARPSTAGGSTLASSEPPRGLAEPRAGETVGGCLVTTSPKISATPSASTPLSARGIGAKRLRGSDLARPYRGVRVRRPAAGADEVDGTTPWQRRLAARTEVRARIRSPDAASTSSSAIRPPHCSGARRSHRTGICPAPPETWGSSCTCPSSRLIACRAVPESAVMKPSPPPPEWSFTRNRDYGSPVLQRLGRCWAPNCGIRTM